MPTFKNGQLVEDSYVFVNSEDEMPDSGRIVVALGRFLEETEELVTRQVQWGIRLNVDSEPELLTPWLEQVNYIEVMFPKFSDGRGYSTAQLLRRRLGYQGELRAVGDIGIDQVGYLQRSGFDSFDFQSFDFQTVTQALNAFSNVYQPAADQSVPIFKKRLARSPINALH